MANKRIIYSVQQVGMKPIGSSADYTPVYGAQDVGISTNFNLQQFFELGQIELYANLETIPDIEVSLSKIFDGKPLIWHIATQGATAGPSLANRSAERNVFAMAVFADTNDSSTGTPESIVECSGMYPSSISYTFPADGAFTESVTLVGNDKIWSTDTKLQNAGDIARAAALSFDGVFTTNNDTPSGIEQRQNLQFDFNTGVTDVNGMVADPDATILPPDIDGISSSGTNEVLNDKYKASIQNITISTDLGREELFELGRRTPFLRPASFPTEVTCSIEALSTSGDQISATEDGIYSSGSCSDAANLQNSTIRVATCGGVRIYLGTKNKLSSVEYGGGAAEGGEATNTYNFSTFNSMTVMAEYDPNPSGATWWTNRVDYLVDL